MIFVAAKEEPTLVVLLSEQNVNDMRTGRSCFIERGQLKGHRFDKLILGLAKTDEQALAMVKATVRPGQLIPDLGALAQVRQAELSAAGKEECPGCKAMCERGTVIAGSLLSRPTARMCVSCWIETARHYEAMYRGLL